MNYELKVLRTVEVLQSNVEMPAVLRCNRVALKCPTDVESLRRSKSNDQGSTMVIEKLYYEICLKFTEPLDSQTC